MLVQLDKKKKQTNKQTETLEQPYKLVNRQKLNVDNCNRRYNIT